VGSAFAVSIALIVAWHLGTDGGSGIAGSTTSITPMALYRHNGPIAVNMGAGLILLDPTSGGIVGSVAFPAPVTGNMQLITYPISWSPDGSSVVYGTNNAIVTAGPQGLTEWARCSGECPVAWSPDGLSLAFGAGRDLRLVRLSDGSHSTVTRIHGRLVSLSWAPDSRQIALGTTRGTAIADVADHSARLLTTLKTARVLSRPTWSPAGDTIAYFSQQRCGDDRISCPLLVRGVSPDGTADRILLRAGPCACIGFTPSLGWSPDGTQLALILPPTNGHPYGLYTAAADGSGLRFVRHAGWPAAWQPAP